MKIAFISVRGIPNNYGGFEQFAEYISVGLAAKGHEVTVYSPHYHSYKKDEYKGVRIKHIYSPEQWMGGSFGSFFYDFLSLRDALKREKFDIIYEAGYTSIVPAYIWFNVKKIKSPVFTTNMDGLEYKRTKFNKWVRKFIFWEERMTVKHSHFLIADNKGIQQYYKEKYNRESAYLAYGANLPEGYDLSTLQQYRLVPDQYYLVIARLEPENSIEMIIQAYLGHEQNGKTPLVIVGKTNTPFGKYLVKQYGSIESVRFLEGIYNAGALDNLRHYSLAYFHGHTVGGTNPSLLEAMAAGCFIWAHDNPFNKSVLNENAFYFSSKETIIRLLNEIDRSIEWKEQFVRNNLNLIEEKYSWQKLVEEHENYFLEILNLPI